MNASVDLSASRETALQVLTLALHGELFAVEARCVREILDLPRVTEVPGTADCLNGLVNVRGKVVPLLDLCLKLGMPHAPPTIDSRIVVVELTIGGEPIIVGLRADRVYEMTELAGNALASAPQIGMRIQPAFVRCVGQRAGDFVIVLNLEAIFADIEAAEAAGKPGLL